MSKNTVCKIIRQYSKEPISREDMGKLLEIGEDYRKIKNYVYERFGGIAGLSKLYPGYTIQNEMTKSGLRRDLGIPSVYFYLAVFDAIGDIKSQWTRTKSKILERIGRNDGFSQEEKHYLRFLLKVSNAFEAVVNQNPIKLSGDIWEKYEKLAALVNPEKLHRYLCRQVRKVHVKLHTDVAEGFSLGERAYRYGENGADVGIYVSTKEKRKRIFVSLTDQNQYKCQIYMKLYPKEARVEIHVPVNVAVKNYEDYGNDVGIAMGMYTMLTTDLGHCYGEELGKYQMEYAKWLQEQAKSYSCNKEDNPGRKKYQEKKRRYTEQLHGYINQELNRFLRIEKPREIYMVKLPKPQSGGINRKINYSVTVWQRGYIRKRLEQKCRERSVRLVEVLGKDISRECSKCGEIGSGKAGDCEERKNLKWDDNKGSGKQKDGMFYCVNCGYEAEEKTNTARNVLRRGKEGRIVNKG
ncbi:hypothetical protein D3Z58_02750 [Clostridiaceae bacterium]|nr:hypothetical protein [Clostridiaceae bacterium]